MRVLIAQPNALLQEGLAQVFRSVVPRASMIRAHKRELLKRAAESDPPAVAIVGYPWVSLATLRTLRLRHPWIATIVVIGRMDAPTLRRLLAGHVAAIVPDSAPPEVFAAALRLALCGDVTVQDQLLREEPGAESVPARPRIGALNLTPRQFDVLRLVANGRTNKYIASELGVGLRTVKGHMAVILRALQSDNRRDAGRRARRWLARN
jgi:DNA-binding NarL/FixJ family response regulator